MTAIPEIRWERRTGDTYVAVSGPRRDSRHLTGASEFEAVVYRAGTTWVARCLTFHQPLAERPFFNRASAQLWAEAIYSTVEEACAS